MTINFGLNDTQPTNPNPGDLPAEPANPILERNLAALRKRTPWLAQRLAHTTPHPGLVIETAPDGAATATLDGKRLASSRRPLEEASRLADTIDLDAAAVICVLGLGLAHHVRALNQRAGRTAVQVVFEPDEQLLRAVLEHIDIADILNTGDLLIVTDPNSPGELSAAIKGSEGMAALGVTFLDHPPSTARLAHHTPAFTKTFAEAIEAVRTTLVTTLVQTDVTLRNILMNAGPYTKHPGVAHLKDTTPGTPAAVISAGPSLARNIQHLLGFGIDSDREHDLTIIATQTTLKPLLDAGITPHYVVALDYHEVSTRFYENLDENRLKRTILVAEPKANPAIIDAYPGPIALTNDEALEQILGPDIANARAAGGPDGTIPPGATVAHLAYELARHLGANPVLLVGQDLAFTDGQYYADGAAVHDVWATELSDITSVESMEWTRVIRGKGHLKQARDHLNRPVYTDAQMATYLDQFERLFLRDQQNGLATLDCTEGGLPKRGAHATSLANALLSHATPKYEARNRVLPIDAAPQPNPDLTTQTTEQLRTVLRGVRQIERLSDRTARKLESLTRLLPSAKTKSDKPGSADRANTTIREIHALRDKVHATGNAFELVQRLNQGGALKRYRADRAIKLAEAANAPEPDIQKLRVERDATSVKWHGEAANLLAELLEASIAALSGAPKRTRDAVYRSTGQRVTAHKAAPPCAAAVRVAPGDPTNTFQGRPVLALTLGRLSRIDGLRDVALLPDDDTTRAELARTLETCGGRSLCERRGIRVRIADDSRTDEQRTTARAYHQRLDRGRHLAPDSWRSSGAPSIFDEALEPEWTLALLDSAEFSSRLSADPTVLILGASWGLFDPTLAQEVAARHAEAPDQHPMTFTQAATGLAPCAVGRKLLHDLAESRRNGSVAATIAQVLGYAPTKPRRDPIANVACVRTDPSARDATLRCTIDSRTQPALAEHVAEAESANASAIGSALREQLIDQTSELWRTTLPSLVTFETGGGTPSDCPRANWFVHAYDVSAQPPLSPDTVRLVVAEFTDAGLAPRVRFAGIGGTDGTGDPINHPHLAELIEAARDAGAPFVAVRTDLDTHSPAAPDDPRIAALLHADAVEAELLAQTKDTYRYLTGRDTFGVALANAETIWNAFKAESAVPTRWLVPRLTRCDEVYAEVEAFFDIWTVTVGLAAIDPLPATVLGARIGPLIEPRLARLRRAATELVVRSDGAFIFGDPWRHGSGDGRMSSPGVAERAQAATLWRRIVAERCAACHSAPPIAIDVRTREEIAA